MGLRAGPLPDLPGLPGMSSSGSTRELEQLVLDGVNRPRLSR